MSESQQHRVVVVGADGQPVGEMEVPAEVVSDTDGDEAVTRPARSPSRRRSCGSAR